MSTADPRTRTPVQTAGSSQLADQKPISRAGAPSASGASPGTPSASAQQARQRLQRTASAGPAGAGPAALKDTFVDERNDVLAVINELEDQLDRQEEIREKLERELTNTTEKLHAANTRAQELEWQLVTLQTRVDALEQTRQQITTLEEELKDANARAQRAREQLAVAEKERQELRNELKLTQKQLDDLWAVRQERDGLRNDYTNLTLKLDTLERQQRELIDDRASLQAQLQDLRAALEQVAQERNQWQMNARTAEERIRELTQVQDSLTEKLDAVRAEKKNLQGQIVHLERENARLVEQRQFYECEVSTLRNQLRTAETTLASVKKAFTEVRLALTETKARARRRALDNWPHVGSVLAPDSTLVPNTVVASAARDIDSIVPGEPFARPDGARALDKDISLEDQPAVKQPNPSA